MNQTQLAERQDRAASEPFVMQRVEEGFRVYAASEPKNRYIVSGSPESPECTCPDFQYHRSDPDWQCKHILAVLKECSDSEVPGNGDHQYETEERKAIQDEGRKPRKSRTIAAGNGKSAPPAVLTLKRSVSPDGRIDSLSVEFASPVETLAAEDVVERARAILGVQTVIVEGFRGAQPPRNGQKHGSGNDRGNGQSQNGQSVHRQNAASEGSAAVPARVLGVSGMDGKWGRRLFLSIEAEGKVLRLFGKAAELAEHLASIGFTDGAEQVTEGLSLNIPCRITTKPSPDGRYQNIDKLLPPVQKPAAARGWR